MPNDAGRAGVAPSRYHDSNYREHEEALAAAQRSTERTFAAEGAGDGAQTQEGTAAGSGPHDPLVQLRRLLWRYAEERAPARAPH